MRIRSYSFRDNRLRNSKEMYTIGISCIGGGVGQSVINSCRLSNLPLKTVGIDTNPFAYGGYDCDIFDSTVSVYADNYIDQLLEKCKKHNIDLLIPGHDHELLIYARHAATFSKAGIQLVVPGEELIKRCRDKERMSRDFGEIADVFVNCYNKETLYRDIREGHIHYPLIAKPRGGSASRGIEIIRNEQDLKKIQTDHIVQEMAIPETDDPNYGYFIRQIEKNKNPQVSEISIQIVTDKNGCLLGKMASFNRLKDGIPIEISPVDDDRVWSVVDQLVPHFIDLGLKGPLNIQGRLTNKGLKIFEMNPRFTGITGLRALMGFNEVEACITSWLNLSSGLQQLTLNRNLFGIRQTADRAIPLSRKEEVGSLSNKINGKKKESRHHLLLTKANGYFAQCLIKDLLETTDYTIFACGRDIKKLRAKLPGSRIHFFEEKKFLQGHTLMGRIDMLLHMGFSDQMLEGAELAKHLAFTQRLLTSATMHQIPAVIHISSQNVYGRESDTVWNEHMRPAPQTSSAQADYATELLLESIRTLNHQTKSTSLRLATLTGKPESELIAQNMRQAMLDEETLVNGGSPMLEVLDVRDAISAVKRILHTPSELWKPIYNIGSGRTRSLKEIMETNRFKSWENKSESAEIEKKLSLNIKMDSSLFKKDTGWKPSYQINKTQDA